MKNTTKIMLAALLAVLASLGVLYLSGHIRTASVQPVLPNANMESGNGPGSNSGSPATNPGSQTAVAERVYAAAFPLRAVWIANSSLYLLDGAEANARPVQVATPGGCPVDWMTSWSPDGRWLLFFCTSKPGNYDEAYLWVVRADGTGAYQVDQQPVFGVVGDVAWSPTDDLIAYNPGTANPAQPGGNLKIARIGDRRAQIATLLSGSNAGFAWAPDGRSLAVSFPHLDIAPYSPLHVDRVTLNGKRTRLFSVGTVGRQDFYQYLWSAVGMKFSPDGHYLAYHLEPESASMSMDGVQLQVIDLQTNRIIDLGKGLNNPDWFAWSPDSKHLAFILGEGRFPTTNKKLQVLNTEDDKISDCSRQGEVDTYPVWAGRRLVFCRGPENPQWGSSYTIPVPGQRIWMLSGNQAAPLTTGPANTEDEMVGISPDGNYLAYLRLTDPDHGSLYLQSLGDGRETELLRLSLPGGIRLYSTWTGSRSIICF